MTNIIGGGIIFSMRVNKANLNHGNANIVRPNVRKQKQATKVQTTLVGQNLCRVAPDQINKEFLQARAQGGVEGVRALYERIKKKGFPVIDRSVPIHGTNYYNHIAFHIWGDQVLGLDSATRDSDFKEAYASTEKEQAKSQ